MKVRLFLAVLVAGLCAVPAPAERPLIGAGPCYDLKELWRSRKSWCPDDYCRKGLPPVPCSAHGADPDDYCRKPLPPAPCRAPCGCADDYAARGCPIRVKTGEPWYTCAPIGGCACGRCTRPEW